MRLRDNRDAAQGPGRSGPRRAAHSWSLTADDYPGDLHPRGLAGTTRRAHQARRLPAEEREGDPVKRTRGVSTLGVIRHLLILIRDVCVELRGLEPLTPCLQSKVQPSLNVAWHRRKRRSPVVIPAGFGWVSPGAWRHWLPTWLPNAVSSAKSCNRGRAADRFSRPDQPTQAHGGQCPVPDSHCRTKAVHRERRHPSRSRRQIGALPLPACNVLG